MAPPLLVFLYFSILFHASTLSAPFSLNAPCSASGQCPSNSRCRSICGSSTSVCACDVGYVNDQHGSCKKVVPLGGTCVIGRDICATANASAVNGLCQCRPGFTTGPTGIDCVPSGQSRRFGDWCSSSSMCFYNMQCISNSCQCPPGYITSDNLHCTPRPIGDSCTTDDDCSGVAYSSCSGGVCTCLYDQVQYYRPDSGNVYKCSASWMTLGRIGDYCSDTSPCESYYVCKICFENATLSTCQYAATRPTTPITSTTTTISPARLASQGLGESCTSSVECSSSNSRCSPLSSGCSVSSCNCVQGYRPDYVKGICKREVGLGGTCDQNDFCSAEGSACLARRCSCIAGYKTGFFSDCVSNLKTSLFGQKCYDSVQCYGNMQCMGSRCDCYPGQTATAQGVSCRDQVAGDSCTNYVDDCSRTPNTRCLNGVCACETGYKQVSYMVRPNEQTTACILNNEYPVELGGECSTVVGSSGNLICQMPYSCGNCTSGVNQCG